MNWLIDDVIKLMIPRVIGALLALGLAHSDWLAKYGITVDWNTFGGKVTTGVALLIGLLATHHVRKVVVKPAP